GGQTAGMQIQSGATVDIINSTIADNGTSGVYGGLIVNSSDTTVTLTNSTVSGNVAGSGMVLITNSAVLNLNNSILANGNGGSDCTNNGGTVNFSTGTSNLIESNSSGFSCGTAGTNFIEADPELSTLADNGGNVQTLLPADTSPVINAGDNASALDASGSPLTTDARGESRFIGTVDLGAVELPQIATIEFTAADTSGAESTANPLILTLTTTDGAATEAAFTVTLAVTPGTATLTDDYTFNTSFMVPAGTASGTPFAIPNTDFAVVDDTRYEPDETLTLALSSPSSGAVLGTVGSTTYTITNDDAIPVVTVAPAGPITLDEATTQAQVFTFTADTAPLADVTIPISVSSTACETNATEVVLTAANYLTGAVVTVTAIDNAIADPDQRCDLVTGDTTSTDVAYEAVGADDVADVEITIVDDELAQVFVTPTGLATLSETGPELQDFTFTLSTEPTTEVNIPLATSSTECVLSIDTVTIDNTTWETGVSVTVTAVDDIIAEVTEACNLWTLAPDTTDTGYGALTAADVPNRLINITDNDTASITLSPEQSGRITLNEDDTTGVTYTFTLGTEPEANVTIPLVTSSDACTVSSDSVVLDSTNYATGVSFTVVPVDNLLDDGDRVCNLWTLAPASTDAAYDAFTATDTPNRLITIVDDEETPGILISPSAAQELLEAGEQSIDYTVTLASEPSAAVTFSASMSSSECTLTGSPVVLDSSNWNTGVSLTVQAIDDGINDGNQACNLWTLDPSSSDPLYDGLTATDTPNRFITIIDNPSVDDVLNLIENGAFNTPIGSEWSQSGNITADNPSGELEMTLTQTDGVAIIEQNTGVAASSGTILSAELQLGNTGSETKQVRVNLLNTNSDGSIGEVKACIFYVPGNTALETYTLTTSINNNWSNTTFRIALRESTEPALLVDNVVVEVRPDLSVNGTTCTPASRLSRSVSPTALDLSAMPVVEEVTEAQAAAAPAAGAAPVETEEAAVTIEEPVVEATPTVTEEATVEQTEPVADATPDVTEEALPTLDVEEVTTDESFTEVTPEVAPVEEAAVVEETVEEAAVPVTEVSAEVGTTGE
ncbi:MAG: choice-of-anchor Q domain-containing protein, partial [Chloroflexota bacterium]